MQATTVVTPWWRRGPVVAIAVFVLIVGAGAIIFAAGADDSSDVAVTMGATSTTQVEVGPVGPTPASVTHVYELDGSFDDLMGGPSLVPHGGTLGVNSYSFGENQGFSLSGGLEDPADYSIELVFQLADARQAFSKIIDFKDREDSPYGDGGLYVREGAVWFYGLGGARDVDTFELIEDFEPNTDAHFVLTRDGITGAVVGYVNGLERFTADDSLVSYAVASAPEAVLHFFMDDERSKTEASAGIVDYIRIYDGVLSAEQVSDLAGGGPPPEG